MQHVPSLFKIALLSLICFFLLLFFGCSYTNTFPEGLGETIDESDELKSIIENDNQDFVIVDVRPEYKYKEGHIPSAINIPNGDLQSLENPPPKDKYLILYCETGLRVESTFDNFIDAGYQYLYNWGGMGEYNYPLELAE